MASVLLPSANSEKNQALPLKIQDWPAYGGAPENIHYSPLTQINRTNVKQRRCNRRASVEIRVRVSFKIRLGSDGAGSAYLFWRNKNDPI
jgi:hypothetical protein